MDINSVWNISISFLHPLTNTLFQAWIATLCLLTVVQAVPYPFASPYKYFISDTDSNPVPVTVAVVNAVPYPFASPG
jgi:hypothetical protein